MATRQREEFLHELASALRAARPGWLISDHQKVEYPGQPRNLWPEADILIEHSGLRFTVECDDDSDPGRSLTKYWPTIHNSDKSVAVLIEVWKTGPTYGRGFAELAKWMGGRLEELYPWFTYRFIERIDEDAETMAGVIAASIEAELEE